ncbi:MAG: hypothetical protein BMS9Abin20_1283 [Acidimicrobiia bacterium]|nr:MAG: hypothetical protein BMS9Abin20_1283 [Acidimicrobiia bacterium]
MKVKKKKRGVGDIARYTGGRSTAPPSLRDEYEDEDLTSGVTFALVAFAAFLVIVFLAVQFGTARIEADLETRSLGALVTAGYPDVQAEATGTSVRLSGSMTSDQFEDVAFATVAQLRGVGNVDGKLWPIFTGEITDIVVTGDAIDITWSSDSAVVSGSISTEDKRTLVLDSLSDSFSRGVDIEGLAVVEGLKDESSWLGSTLGLVKRFASLLEEGRIILDPNSEILTVAGETEDRALRNELNELAIEAGASMGVDVNPAVRLLELAPTQQQVEELQVNLDDLIEGKVVEFEVKSYDLTDVGTVLLDEILAALDLVPNVRVEIAGYTDSQGSDEANQILSEQRAQAVLDYLVANGAIRDRFDVVGYGEAEPVADNNTAEGRARNRRIEFTALLEG